MVGTLMPPSAHVLLRSETVVLAACDMVAVLAAGRATQNAGDVQVLLQSRPHPLHPDIHRAAIRCRLSPVAVSPTPALTLTALARRKCRGSIRVGLTQG